MAIHIKQTYSLREVVIILLAAVLIAGSIGAFLGKINESKADQASDVKVPDIGLDLSIPLGFSGENKVEVDDQPAGNDVSIGSVTTKNQAWLAIHEDKDGKPGNILGAKRYAAGTTRETVVELLRPTVSGIYYAMLHADNGDEGFDHKQDAPLMEQDNPVMRRFLVEGDAHADE